MSDSDTVESAAVDDVAADLEAAILRQNLHREILFKTLGYCSEEHTLEEIENEISSYPEFETALQSQYFMVKVLVKHGGLDCYASGEAAASFEEIADMEDAEVCDLIDNATSFKASEIGSAYYNDHLPEKRLEELFDAEPDREDTYREIMEYCAEQSHAYTDIAELLDGRDILRVYEDDGRYLDLQPSVFLDKLERAGGMIWTRSDGWATSDEGKAFAGLS